MTPPNNARTIATDIEKWMRAQYLPLSRLARWKNVVETLRRLADDNEALRRRSEHLAYDLEQAKKVADAQEQQIEFLKQQIISQS